MMMMRTNISKLKERIAELLRARDESASLITAERERMDALVERQAATIAELREALHRISLASQNSMSSKTECGTIARAALARTGDENRAKALSEHEHAVAKVAVEALKDAVAKQRASRLYSATDEMEEALVKIEASGWKPS